VSGGFLDTARCVLAQYPVIVKDIRIIQGEAKKAIWLVATDRGALALKRHARPVRRVVFSLCAQEYISLRGGRVPGLLRPDGDSLHVEEEGMAFSLSSWVEGRQLVLEREEDLFMALEALGHFHRSSQGFKIPAGVQVSTKLGRWPHHYSSMTQRLSEWSEVASERRGTLGHIYQCLAPEMLDMAAEALALLEGSGYGQWVEQASVTGNLCHQDYGQGNAIMGDGGVWVIDLDDITLDLPARDLRKITNKAMKRRGGWDGPLFLAMMEAYERERPLSDSEKRVLFVDLLFPHVFHDTAKNPFRKGKATSASKLEEAFALERSKRQAILPLLG
jgi:spore coat protein I